MSELENSENFPDFAENFRNLVNAPQKLGCLSIELARYAHFLLVEDSKSVMNYDKSGVLSQFAPFFDNYVLLFAVCASVQHKHTEELCHGLEQLCHDLLSFCQGLWANAPIRGWRITISSNKNFCHTCHGLRHHHQLKSPKRSEGVKSTG